MLKSKDKKPDIKKIVSKMGIVFVLIALIILWSSLSQSFLDVYKRQHSTPIPSMTNWWNSRPIQMTRISVWI